MNTSPSLRRRAPALTLYYDGSCALCVSQMRALQARDRAGRLCFVDASATELVGAPAAREALMQSIHAVDADGAVHVGVPALRRAQEAVGLGCLNAVLQLPGASRLADRAYALLARHRHRWPLGNAGPRGAEAAHSFAPPCRDGHCARPPQP